MDEKILAKSKRYNIVKLMIILIMAGLVLSLIRFCVVISDHVAYYEENFENHTHTKNCYHWTWSKIDAGVGSEELDESKMDCVPARYGNALNYAFSKVSEGLERANENGILGFEILQYAGWFLMLSLIGVLLFLWMRSYELTVTDKRVYGKVAFGKRVDLPLDSISATSTISLLKGVAVSTASGKISFLVIKNAAEIYETVSALMIERQQKKQVQESAPAAAATPAVDAADQIVKYKKLLDDGIISQQEFDIKKNQLLGL